MCFIYRCLVIQHQTDHMNPQGFFNEQYLSSSVWGPDAFIQTPADMKTSVGSLKRISMEAVLLYPPLVEEISPLLPQSLRREMINMGFNNNFSSLALPLFYTWANPRLALTDLLDEDASKNSWNYRQTCLRIIVQYLTEKIISIKSNNSKAVRLIDLTGCLVPRQLVEQLLETKFTSTEQVTVLIDVIVSSSERGYTKWVSLLGGSDHVRIKVNNLWVENVREAQRNSLLAAALASNESLAGLKISNLMFEDWPELYRSLNPLLQFSQLSRLDLSGNNLIDSSDTDVTGREWINRFLKKFPKLSRLNLSRNRVRGKVQSVLTGLNLTYLGLCGCKITSQDLAFILSIKSLKQLDISGFYEPFELQPTAQHFESLETWNISLETLNLGFWQPSREEFLVIHNEVLKNLPHLQHLDVSHCNLSNAQISKILQLAIPSIEFHIALSETEWPSILNETLSELLKEHGYCQCNVQEIALAGDKSLSFRAILK